MPQHSFKPNALGVLVEELIDKHTLQGVLEALGDIATEKAIHIESNWQDPKTAAVWKDGAAAVYKAYAKVTSLGI